MGYIIPAIIILGIILVAAIVALVYFRSKDKAAGADAGDDAENINSSNIVKGLIAVVVLVPLVIIMLIVFSLSGNNDHFGSDNTGTVAENGENAPEEVEVFEPLSLPQMTYRELRRHNLMLMDWVKTCDKNATGTFLIQTKYQKGEDTIREMLLYRNDGAYNVEMLPDDETFPDEKGIYFNCVKNKKSDAGYTIAFYSWKENNNDGDCYVTEAGKVITLKVT